MNISSLSFLIYFVSLSSFAQTDKSAIFSAGELHFWVVLIVFGAIVFLLAYSMKSKLIAKNTKYDLIKYSTQPIFVTNAEGKIIFINDVAKNLIGIENTNGEIVNIFDLIDGLPECLMNNVTCQQVDNEQHCHCKEICPSDKDFSLICHDDHTIPIKIDVLRQANGSNIYYLKLLVIEKKLQQQLESQNKVATLGEFLAGILHEVGNPMAAIEGVSANLLWQLTNDKENVSNDYLQEQINLIQAQARRVNHIKNEFSLISQNSDLLSNQMQWFDLNDLLTQLIELIKYDKRTDQIEISYQADKGMPAIYTHKDKLTQILLNVFSNAIDVLQQQDKASISVLLSHDKSSVKVNILDNGLGLDAQELERIFEAFYTTKSKGIGLGLMICKQLANSLSMDFNMTSQVSIGTQVELIIPISDKN
tara:strand:- start:20474 stop:21733 length:1260 start_codon:yes stop_codon:yes gene_type:complete